MLNSFYSLICWNIRIINNLSSLFNYSYWLHYWNRFKLSRRISNYLLYYSLLLRRSNKNWGLNYCLLRSYSSNLINSTSILNKRIIYSYWWVIYIYWSLIWNYHIIFLKTLNLRQISINNHNIWSIYRVYFWWTQWNIVWLISQQGWRSVWS